MGIEELRRINSDIVHEDGSIDSFDRQLIDLSSGVYNVTNPMVVSPESKSIAYAGGVDKSKPIVINVSTVIKLREKHQLGYAFVSRINEMLDKSYLAFDSLVQDTSRIFLLDESSELQAYPLIAVCRYDKNIKMIEVNEITSIYEKTDFDKFLLKTYENNKNFYCNEKTKASIKSHAGFQLPREIIDALSVIDYSGSFNKSQIEDTTSVELEVIETQQEVVIPVEEAEIIEESNSSLLENVSMEDDGIDFD